MRRITGALREHVFQSTCPTEVDEALEGGSGRDGGAGETGRGKDEGEDRNRCLNGPYMVDVRYDISSDQVAVLICSICSSVDGVCALKRKSFLGVRSYQVHS